MLDCEVNFVNNEGQLWNNGKPDYEYTRPVDGKTPGNFTDCGLTLGQSRLKAHRINDHLFKLAKRLAAMAAG